MKPPIQTIFVFFTWDVSLTLWKDKGLFAREVQYYAALAEHGYKIIFLTWGGEEDFAVAQDLPEMIEIIPAYKWLPRPRSQILRALLSPLALWHARKSLGACSIIKTNQMWGAWCAVLAKIIFRKPLLVRTGFELYQFTIAQKHGLLRRLTIYCLSKLTYTSADMIYVAGIDDKKFVEEAFKIPAHKIAIRPNWIDIANFNPPSQPRRENEILYVGRLTHQKNLPLLLKAVNDTSWTITIIGEGEMRPALETLAQQTNTQINFLGTVANDGLPEYYQRCTIFVLPSFYEGNPKTLLEAMACGCAVVGTNVDGISTVIENGVSGVLCGSKPSSLNAAIETLMNNRNTRETLGDAATLQIKTTQALDILIEKEINDYEGVLKRA